MATISSTSSTQYVSSHHTVTSTSSPSSVNQKTSIFICFITTTPSPCFSIQQYHYLTASSTLKNKQTTITISSSSSNFVSKITTQHSCRQEESKNIVKALHASDIEDQKVLNPFVLHHSNECTTPLEAKNIVSARKHITKGGTKDESAFDQICTNTTFENDSVEKCTLIANNSNTDLEKF
ncbi:hypothetical protein RYX36_012732 [Vicia faba]